MNTLCKYRNILNIKRTDHTVCILLCLQCVVLLTSLNFNVDSNNRLHRTHTRKCKTDLIDSTLAPRCAALCFAPTGQYMHARVWHRRIVHPYWRRYTVFDAPTSGDCRVSCLELGICSINPEFGLIVCPFYM